MPLKDEELYALTPGQKRDLLAVGSRWRDRKGFELVIEQVYLTDRMDVDVLTWGPGWDKTSPGRPDGTNANFILAVYDRVGEPA